MNCAGLMNTNYGFGGDEVREESSWRYPIGIFLATLILCAIFLYYYVGPTYDDISGTVPSPTPSDDPVSFSVSRNNFRVAANFTVFPRERRGGEFEKVTLYALWPNMTGYSSSSRLEFIDNDPDTKRIDIQIAERPTPFGESKRIEDIYMPHTVDERGSRTPYRLTRFTFRPQRDAVPTNGYADTTLFVGKDANEQEMALFCYNEIPSIPSPECWREYELGDDLSVTYRFKRPYLAEWFEIDSRVRQFVEALQVE